MGLENIKYDAFISYRHCELDKFNAMAIQKKLENFKLPKSLYSKTANGKTKIERVFRDQDELPLASNLSDPIETALENSEFLIVICTPRLRESQWCAKEIETFIKLHGRDRILAVLAEGEPDQSFPESLRFVNKIVLDEQGNEHEERVEIEPLAADTRGENQRAIKKQIDDATLRLAAPIFGLNYDDLKQRHKEQRTKKIITIASCIAAVFFVFAMVCMFLALRISSQKNTIEDQYAEIEAKNVEIEANNKAITAQNKEITAKNEEITAKNEEIQAQNKEITAKNDEITAKNEEISEQYHAEQIKYAESMADASKALLTKGRKKDAIYAIRQAMSDTTEDTELPYTAAAERALADALGLYDNDNTLVPMNVFELDMSLEVMDLSPNGRYLMTIDTSNHIIIFDTETGKKILDKNFETSSKNPVWLSDQSFVYGDGVSLLAYDIATGESTMVHECARNYLADTQNSRLYVYEYENDWEYPEEGIYLAAYDTAENLKQVFKTRVNLTEIMPDYLHSYNMAVNKSGSLVAVLSEASSLDTFGSYVKAETTLSVVDTKTGELVLEEILSFPILVDVAMDEKSVYILSHIPNYSDMALEGTALCAISIDTGDLEWEKNFDDTTGSKLTIVFSDSKKSQLIVDFGQMMMFYRSSTGELVNYCSYSGYLKKGYVVGEDKNFQRLMIMEDGSLRIYMSESNLVYDQTATYYKYFSGEGIRDCIFNRPSFYMCYANDKYIVRYDLLLNQNVQDKIDIKSVLDDGSYQPQFSADYKYALTTVSSHNEAGEYVDTHNLYDLASGTKLCSVTDGIGSVAFINGRDEFVVFSNIVKIYDFSGKLLYEETFESYSSFPDISVDGRCLIFTDFMSDKYVIFDLEEHKEIMSVPYDHYFDEKVLVVKEAGIVVHSRENGIESYSFGNTTPQATLELNNDIDTSIVLSDDGRFVFVSSPNYTLDIYSAADLKKVKSLYFLNSNVRQVVYCNGISSYLVITDNANNYLLNEKLECTRNLPYCRAYDSKENKFIAKSTSLYSIPYFRYEGLISQADSILQDYEPTEYIKSKYHF